MTLEIQTIPANADDDQIGQIEQYINDIRSISRPTPQEMTACFEIMDAPSQLERSVGLFCPSHLDQFASLSILSS